VNVPPTASFIYNPVSPIATGETPVAFNASGSRDSDGSIASYNWSWGDGTPDQSITSPTITHVFADTPARCVDVTYAVLLTVVDDSGGVGTASQQVKVTELPLPADPVSIRRPESRGSAARARRGRTVRCSSGSARRGRLPRRQRAEGEHRPGARGW
jgi:hypothetical protein